MRRCCGATWLLKAASLAVVVTSLPSLENSLQNGGISSEQACGEFVSTSAVVDFEPSWTFDDCVAVWDIWAATVPVVLRPRYDIRDRLREIALELRKLGSPCVLEAASTLDGAGSCAVRTLSNWVLAEEIGCDLVTPEWGRSIQGANGTVLYCHERTPEANEKVDHSVGLNYFMENLDRPDMSCVVVNWLQFFRFDMVGCGPVPSTGSVKVIEVRKQRKGKFE